MHAGRLIKKLIPRSVLFQEELDRVLDEFWDFYHTGWDITNFSKFFQLSAHTYCESNIWMNAGLF